MSEEVLTEVVCENCEHYPEEETNFCPECGEEEPWIERNKYEFDEDDLPIVFEHTFNQAGGQMWDSFAKHYFDAPPGLKGTQVADFPSIKFPRMKKARVHVWYIVTEDYDLEGPYMTEEKAREVVK